MGHELRSYEEKWTDFLELGGSSFFDELLMYCGLHFKMFLFFFLNPLSGDF